MLSLVDVPPRPNSPKKAKEAEDIGHRNVGGKQEEDNELIILRRKISLLNAQHAVQARDSVESLEQKEREILTIRSEISNLEQTVTRERLLRKKAEERVEALENEVQKLRRLALAYKTKLMKSSMSGNTEMINRGAGGMNDELVTPRLELPHDQSSLLSSRSPLISSLSTGSVPASQINTLTPSITSSSATNLAELISRNQVLDFSYILLCSIFVSLLL